MNKLSLFKDVRFWIFLFFAIRLLGITNPPLEVGHNWRQTTVAMVARNFLEVDSNIFYPRIDFAGEKTGITGMEFPLFNYLIFLLAKIFGYQHWYGRLLNLVVTSLGLWYFFKLIKKFFKGKVAFDATIILAVSIWFQFARKIMPDTFAMSLIIGAIYYGVNYFDTLKGRRYLYLFLFALLFTAGTLSKLPSGYIVIIFAAYLVNKEIRFLDKLVFTITGMVCLVPIFVWYFDWVPHLVETFGFWHFFMGKSMSVGALDIIHNMNATLKHFYETALKFIGFGVFAMGVFYLIKNKNKLLGFVLISSFSCFLIIILKAGFTFYHHNYYIIPFVPVMALIAGYGLNYIKNKKVALGLLILICIEGIANQQHDLFIKAEEKYMAKIEYELDKFIPRDELIMVNSGYVPTPMYFTHRKGWIASNEQIVKDGYLHDLQLKGLKYVLVLKKNLHEKIPELSHKKLTDNSDFVLYELQ